HVLADAKDGCCILAQEHARVGTCEVEPLLQPAVAGVEGLVPSEGCLQLDGCFYGSSHRSAPSAMRNAERTRSTASTICSAAASISVLVVGRPRLTRMHSLAASSLNPSARRTCEAPGTPDEQA